MNNTLNETQLKKLAQEITGRNDPTEALEEALRSYVEERLSRYRITISRLENKYGLTYETFRQKLSKELPLSWEHEQDYMSWEEALTNLEYFERIASQLTVHA